MRLLSTVVTKASQVKAGDLFRIVGNNSAGFPIPEQLFLVKTPVLRMSVMVLFWKRRTDETRSKPETVP